MFAYRPFLPFIRSLLCPALAFVLYCSRLHFIFIFSMLYSLLSLFCFFHPVFSHFLSSFPLSLPPFCCFTCLMVKFDIWNVMTLLVLPVLICGYVSHFQYSFICLRFVVFAYCISLVSFYAWPEYLLTYCIIFVIAHH